MGCTSHAGHQVLAETKMNKNGPEIGAQEARRASRARMSLLLLSPALAHFSWSTVPTNYPPPLLLAAPLPVTSFPWHADLLMPTVPWATDPRETSELKLSFLVLPNSLDL